MTHRWSETFGKEAWEWIVKLGNSFSDPEQKKDFWETVKNKKLADASYDVFADFPRDPVVDDSGDSPKAKLAKKYCGEILEVLKHGKRGSA